ncbi:MAG: LysR family transcriptional regulator [Hyphomicrobiales bacterium]|uniref:LysR substrate-binding domain-containing protein n=1 Tax=Rhabdaerophilum calidifontis TaxID=2604328 RepID=UPI00123C692A|nr:LysR substrate-binding domain-containing protein [Rhabdaerophilum calidifontis]MCA1952323.1 LysR family transcriptional regulator [Hyphomicrobiales bacterium]MCA1999719.1 LysR family transcriptional regulator [Hyphomicrobiales bacterium]
MDLRQLRYFVTTAEELHFGRAAERLHIAQPALSIQIKALEETLGVLLLKRTNRVVTLTEAGRLFLKEARRTLEQAQHAATMARRAGRGEVGRIEIGYSADVSYSGVLSRILRQYRQQVPDIELGLHELHPSTQIAQLLEGRIQIGCLASFIGNPAWRLPPALDAIRLMEWPLRVALPADHPLARRSRIAREALAGESFILYVGSDPELDRALVQLTLGFVPRVAHEVRSGFSLVSLVGAGLGVAIAPSSVSSISVGEHVVYRPLSDNSIKIGTEIVFRHDCEDPAVINFLRMIRADMS